MFTGQTLRTSKPEPRISMLPGWCIYPILVSVFAAQQWQDAIFVCQEATCGKFFCLSEHMWQVFLFVTAQHVVRFLFVRAQYVVHFLFVRTQTVLFYSSGYKMCS